jgi:hypothetical protein
MTATKIIFDDDVQLVVTGELQQLQNDLYDAMNNGGWLVIRPDLGPLVSVNPRQILYMQELTPEEAQEEVARLRENGVAPVSGPGAREARQPQSA